MKRAASEFVASGRPGISPLGVMEITSGFEETLQEAKLKAFLEHILPMFEVVSYGIPEACLAGEIYSKLESRGLRIGIADTGIAATAIVQGLTVVTSNLKHFGRVLDLGYSLEIENWRES